MPEKKPAQSKAAAERKQRYDAVLRIAEILESATVGDDFRPTLHLIEAAAKLALPRVSVRVIVAGLGERTPSV